MPREDLEKDLYDCIGLMGINWTIQKNKDDFDTNFIYKCNTLSQCLEEIEKRGLNKNYVLHRWYNYKTSIETESIFCTYGATHCENLYDHDKDIYINNIPFDVKLTCYPKKLFKEKPYNLTKRSGKNDMINWLYTNQSQENRKQLLNRLYVICDGDSYQNSIINKSNFVMIESVIKVFMDYIKTNKINEIVVNGKKVLSDIIYIKPDEQYIEKVRRYLNGKY